MNRGFAYRVIDTAPLPQTNIAGHRRIALTPLGLFFVAAVSLSLALTLSSCTNVAGFSQPSLVRVIDASYLAPGVNIYVEKSLLAANTGEGYISNYGTVTPSAAAPIQVTAANGGASLIATTGSLLAGQQHSVFLTDNAAAPIAYTVTILADQQTGAPSGHSTFRFLNQATHTGAVDVYMIPANVTIANSIPLITDLSAGTASPYTTFASQTVTMVVVPTGLATPKYTSAPIALTGGEVRTVVMVDSQLTSNPPVNVVIADDVN